MPAYFVVTRQLSEDDKLEGSWPGRREGKTWTIANNKKWLMGFVTRSNAKTLPGGFSRKR